MSEENKPITPKESKPVEGTPKETPQQPTENEELQVLKAQVQGLQDLLKPKRKKDRVDEHYGKILFWRDIETDKNYAVLGCKNVRPRKIDGEARLVADFALLNSGKTEVRTLDYLETLTGGIRYKVKILKSHIVEKERNQGGGQPITHRVEESDPVARKKSGKSFISYEVDLVEEFQSVTMDIEFVEGDLQGMKLTVDESSMNI